MERERGFRFFSFLFGSAVPLAQKNEMLFSQKSLNLDFFFDLETSVSHCVDNLLSG